MCLLRVLGLVAVTTGLLNNTEKHFMPGLNILALSLTLKEITDEISLVIGFLDIVIDGREFSTIMSIECT